ncbi:MAG: hypothetical protein AB7I18_07335 [Candidatus Berkiella sp.]
MIVTEKEYHHVISRFTRKIYRMTLNEMKSYAVSGEFVLQKHDKMYEKLLEKGMTWHSKQAIHLLVREDPDDHYWAPSSVYPLSREFKKMEDAMITDHRNGKLCLKEHTDLNGNKTFIAENIVFIRWALERGFNVPELFSDYYMANIESFTLQPNDINLEIKGSEGTDDQKLTRRAIQEYYQGFNWRKLFEKEKVNGLVEAKLTEKRGNKALYSEKLLHKWLTEQGKLNKHQLQRFFIK